jgi:hypothetical protein
MKYLYTEANKFGRQACLMDSFELACKKAREFVGDHNPVDGCSTVPVEKGMNTPQRCEFAVERYTSFGHRRATVQMLSSEVMLELL